MNLTCKVCQARYRIDEGRFMQIPLWKFENCSEECNNVYSKKKLLNLNKKKIFLKDAPRKSYSY